MAIATYKKIASVTVATTTQANIEFTNIPATYTDLVLKVSVRSSRSDWRDGIYISFNGSTSNLAYRAMEVTGAGTPGTFTGSDGFIGNIPGSTNTASTFSNSEILVSNYTGSTNKSYNMNSTQSGNNTTNQTLDFINGRWDNTSVINTIRLTPQVAAFSQYSSVTLYGIVRSN